MFPLVIVPVGIVMPLAATAEVMAEYSSEVVVIGVGDPTVLTRYLPSDDRSGANGVLVVPVT
jgi:hypothetical protein